MSSIKKSPSLTIWVNICPSQAQNPLLFLTPEAPRPKYGIFGLEEANIGQNSVARESKQSGKIQNFSDPVPGPVFCKTRPEPDVGRTSKVRPGPEPDVKTRSTTNIVHFVQSVVR